LDQRKPFYSTKKYTLKEILINKWFHGPLQEFVLPSWPWSWGIWVIVSPDVILSDVGFCHTVHYKHKLGGLVGGVGGGVGGGVPGGVSGGVGGRGVRFFCRFMFILFRVVVTCWSCGLVSCSCGFVSWSCGLVSWSWVLVSWSLGMMKRRILEIIPPILFKNS
jgi:hypothetical protein